MVNFNKDKILYALNTVWFLWAGGFIFNILTFLLIIFKIRPGSPTVALHFNVLAGVEWYGKGYNLYFIPGLGLALGVANFILFRALKKLPNFLAFLVPFVNFCVQSLLLISTLFLMKVN